MGRYQIDHRCGHTASVEITTGKSADRARRAAWLATQDCDECGRARQLETAREANAGLPALVGSDKQVAWAESIRAKLVPQIDAAEADFQARVDEANAAGRGSAKLGDVWAAIQADVAALRSEPAARWWIDNKDYSGKTLFDRIALARTMGA